LFFNRKSRIGDNIAFLSFMHTRENARAQIRVMVKRFLRKYGYPPDLQKAATKLVLEQAEELCREWA